MTDDKIIEVKDAPVEIKALRATARELTYATSEEKKFIQRVDIPNAELNKLRAELRRRADLAEKA